MCSGRKCEQRAGSQPGNTIEQIAGCQRNDEHRQAADRRGRKADELRIRIQFVPEMLQDVEQRRMIIDLVECDIAEGLRRYEVGVSLVHPDRRVAQLVETRDASDQEYYQQADDVRSVGQVLSRAGVVSGA